MFTHDLLALPQSQIENIVWGQLLTKRIDSRGSCGHGVDLEGGDADGTCRGCHLRPDIVVVMLVSDELLIGYCVHKAVLCVERSHFAAFRIT